MLNLNPRQKQILTEYQGARAFSVSQVVEDIQLDASLVTARRDIRELVDVGYLRESGSGRSVKYHKTVLGTLMTPVDAREYQQIDIHNREPGTFDLDLFPNFPDTIFSQTELMKLGEATTPYQKRVREQTPTIQTKELERFVIELSWKSSKIEGNTYTLLDTEALIRDGILAEGKTQDEATMILNHKDALSFVMENKDLLKEKRPDQSFVDTLHQTLTKNLSIDQGIRRTLVGITGANYRPLETEFQIREALEDLYGAIYSSTDTYQKALLGLVGVSYIQPFADGNKRTARLFANALLLADGLAPLSYRNVDERIYREAILVFYELNSIVPMKEMFIDQYIFSTENYAV